jgi:S1-C subfamily serine protease
MGDVAIELSGRLAEAVERAAASVVRVEGRRRGPSSGVVWGDGLIVTADHVLEWDEGIEVTPGGGPAVAATLVGRDPTTDLALLRVGAGLAATSWAEAPALRVGHLVLGVSRAHGLRAELGIVAALGGEWLTSAGGRVDRHLETDLGPYPGFSGSLLVDVSGAALGVNTAGLLRGAGLAVPPPTVKRVVETLAAHGHVRRGFLGVGTMPVRLGPDQEASLGQESGLMVTSVQPGAPAQRAGVLLGDVLLAFGGHALARPRDLLTWLDEDAVGRSVALRVLRGGGALDLDVTVGSREQSGQ